MLLLNVNIGCFRDCLVSFINNLIFVKGGGYVDQSGMYAQAAPAASAGKNQGNKNS